MCGIFGWVSKNPLERNLPLKFCELLRHRGPDSDGFLEIGRHAGIGMTRLAITDLGPTGHQPMSDAGTGVSIVLNGEIYNFKELRRTLVGLGHKFVGSSDTEVLLKSYIQWEERFLDKIEGMFAFAIWDPRSGKLLLYRDRFGQKPLFFLQDDGLFAFSSEASALAKIFPKFALQNSQYLPNFLAHGYVNNNAELFKNIREVPPGSFASLTNGSLEVAKYWNYAEKFLAKSEDSYFEAVKKVDELLNNSIREQIESSDVQVGVMLSSGVDSSLIARKALAIQPHTLLFTLGFANLDFDESSIVKKHFSEFTNQIRVKTIDYDFALITEAVQGLDIPIGDTSVIAMQAITNFASQYTKTCLTGDGADEIFAGYSTYQATVLNELCSSYPFPWKTLAKLVEKLPKRTGNVTMDYKLDSFLRWGNSDSLVSHQNWRRIFSDTEIYRLTGMRPFLPEDKHIVEFSECDDLDLLELCMINDVETWLLNDILIKSDRVSMANSLELRAPYLDSQLAEYAASLPMHFKYQKFQSKKILKELFRRQVGAMSKYSRKRGFGSPVSQWILDYSSDFREVIIFSNLFEKSQLELLFDEHLSRKRNNGQKIYSLFVYALWKTTFESKG